MHAHQIVHLCIYVSARCKEVYSEILEDKSSWRQFRGLVITEQGAYTHSKGGRLIGFRILASVYTVSSVIEDQKGASGVRGGQLIIELAHSLHFLYILTITIYCGW